tara:strand:- start:3615 stop:3761 length:147 start_codon:yes stop_codon:yes gene_type:complete
MVSSNYPQLVTNLCDLLHISQNGLKNKTHPQIALRMGKKIAMKKKNIT